jgi:co-chaperonin GroES (HSP10)
MARSNAIGKMREIAEDELNQTNPRLAHLRALTNNYEATAAELLDGPLAGEVTVLHSQVLVMGYIAPARTAGGIILTDKAVEEDRYQGSTGLVIAMGPGAFKDDAVAKFHGQHLQIGDWVMFVPSDGIGLFINRTPCRLFQDVRILMKVENPNIYY